MTSACQKENKKIIVENNKIINTKSKKNGKLNTENLQNYKVTKKEVTSNNENLAINLKNDNVIFEFRNERLLQGRNNLNNVDEKKTKKALSAVLKMLNKNLSSNSTELQLEYNNSSKNIDNYIFETNEFSKSQNIIAFLPLSGKYSNFGNRIRKALDLSILNFGHDGIKIIYFDTGTLFNTEKIISTFEKLDPKFVIGPFTREILQKIKPYAKKNQLPIFTFSNDIAMVENNVWSLGFSPEEQVNSMISCAIIFGYKKFGVIVPDNLYGKIITTQAKKLISENKNNFYEEIYLSNDNLNNKPELYAILSRFLKFSKTQDTHTKFDTIFIGGRKEFVLEIAPLLAYFNVDSKQVRILGTEKFNNNEIKNEPSLEKSWFPMISSKNKVEFEFLWKDVWVDNINYFANAGFDAGIIAINHVKNFQNGLEHLNNVAGPVTGLIFKANGNVEKPIQVMQIENLGKLTNIEKCSRSMD